MGKAWEEIKATMLASARQGAKELAQALPAFPDSIKPVEQLGTPGNPTQLEVNHEKGNDTAYQQWLASRQQEAAAREQQPLETGLER